MMYVFTITELAKKKKQVTRLKKLIKAKDNRAVIYTSPKKSPEGRLLIRLAKIGYLKSTHIQHAQKELRRQEAVEFKEELKRLLLKNRLRELIKKHLLHHIVPDAHAGVLLTIQAVGKVGEQTISDIRRNFQIGVMTHEYYKGGYIFQASNLHRIEILDDFSAVLITMRDYTRFGVAEAFPGDTEAWSRGGVSFRTYLIVRDTTTGEAHILRVPPKFGNENTKFFQNFKNAEERIMGAVAWTFRLKTEEYKPVLQA